MRERGILFNAPLVRALLAGTKTQTRRLLKPKTEPWRNHHLEGGCHQVDWSPVVGEDGLWWWTSNFAAQEQIGKCRFGSPGDRLWVRETFDAPPGSTAPAEVVYRADYERDPEGATWRPALLMPRWASRITLEVTEIRVQRLQQITEADAKAEGVSSVPFCRGGVPGGNEHREAFMDLWGEINGQIGPESWAANPWIWRVSFRRLP